MLLIGAWWFDLYLGLDYILGIGDYPAIESSDRTDYKGLLDGEMRVFRCYVFQLEELVGGELHCVRGDFSRRSGERTPEQSSDALLPHDAAETVPRVGVAKLPVILHDALHEFDWRHDCSDHQPREGPVLKPIQQTDFGLPPQDLVEFVGAEHDCVHERNGEQRIVDPIEQMQKTFLPDDVAEGGAHSEGRVHLHAHLERVQDVPRAAVGHPRHSPTAEIHQKVQHSNYCAPQLKSTSPRQVTIQLKRVYQQIDQTKTNNKPYEPSISCPPYR